MADSIPPGPRHEQRRDLGGHSPAERPANGDGRTKPPDQEPGHSPTHQANGSREPRWRRPPHKNFRQAYAAIDLGTNNCRLLVARPADDDFVVIDAFSRVVRLGEGLAQSGRLSDAAMDRAVEALRVCADKLKKRGVHLARSVATEA